MEKRISKEGLTPLFEKIGEKLKFGITAYLFGGGAMCFRNQKPSTKDVDLVFVSQKDCADFSSVLVGLGFKPPESIGEEYVRMEASNILQNNGVRVDLFAMTVCNALELSPNMTKRSELLRQFGKLNIKLISNEDIVLFKGITDRTDDTDDIAAIITTSKINWQTVLKECKLQSRNRQWFGSLLAKFYDLKEKHKIDVPIVRELDKLYKAYIIKIHYEKKLKLGLKKEDAIEELRKEGFTKLELKNSGIIT